MDKKFLAPKLFYFAIAGTISCLGPFYGLYFQQLGIPSSQIGILTGLPSLITLIGAPMWTGVADYTHRHRRTLLITLVCALVSLWLVLQGHSFLALLLPVSLYAFFLAPAQPLTDNTVLRMLGEQRKHEFGKQRVLGSIAAGIAGPLVSTLASWIGLRAAFYCAMAFLASGLGIASRMEVDQPIQASSQPAETIPYKQGLKRLLLDPRLAFFLLIILLGMTARSTSFIYLYMHMSDLGAPKSILGLNMVTLMIGELPFLFYSDRFLKRLGSSGLMIASLVASIIMQFTFAWIQSPWLAIAVYLIHGLSYSGMWVAGVAFANHLAPPGLGATAQGIFNAVLNGLGIFFGSYLGGLMYDRYGGANMFFWSGILALFALGLFIANPWKK